MMSQLPISQLNILLQTEMVIFDNDYLIIGVFYTWYLYFYMSVSSEKLLDHCYLRIKATAELQL